MDRIEAAFEAFASRPAVDTGANAVTFAALAALAGAWTRKLDETAAARVAYRLDNGLDWLALDLALLRSGRVAIPLPQFFSEAQVRSALAQSGADCLVCDGEPPPGIASVVPGHPRIHTLRAGSTAVLPPGTAKITFTSGTTGNPKGVCLGARTLIDTAEGVRRALAPVGIQRHLSVLPLSLLLENVAGAYANLLNGGTTALPALAELGLSGSSSIDATAFVAAQQRFRPESMILVPQLLLALTAIAELGMALPDSYRFVAVGGAKVPRSLIDRARAVGIPAYEGYGLSECGSVVALNLPGADRPGSVGRALPHARITARHGEIRVLEPAMRGYTGDTCARAAAVDTGDLGHIDEDGFVHVAGRARNHYITAFGRNLSPEWVEGELCAEIPIASALVFGDAQPANVALLVARGDADADAIAGAVARGNERLPDYARVAAWRIVDGAEFRARGCLTDNGRPRRTAAERAYGWLLEEMYGELKEHA